MQKLQVKTSFEGRFWISPLYMLKKMTALPRKKKKSSKVNSMCREHCFPERHFIWD